MKSLTFINSSSRIRFEGWEMLERACKNGTQERKLRGPQQGGMGGAQMGQLLPRRPDPQEGWFQGEVCPASSLEGSTKGHKW